MRVLRAFFLVIFTVVLLLDLVVVQVGVGVELTLLSPGFVLATMDRTDFYDAARDVALAELAAAPGSLPKAQAQILQATLAEAITPDFLRAEAQVIVPQLYALVTAPGPSPQLVLDLTALRDRLAAALEKVGKQAGMTARQLSAARAGLLSNLPERLDVLKAGKVDPASLAAAAAAYRDFRLAVAGTAGVAVVLGLVVALVAGRRAWGAWLGWPLLVSGAVVAAGATGGRSVVAGMLANPHVLGGTGDPALHAMLTGLGFGLVHGVWLTLLLAGVAAVVAGVLVLVVGRRLGRA